MISGRSDTRIVHDSVNVVIAGDSSLRGLRRAFARLGHSARLVAAEQTLAAVDPTVEAVVIAAERGRAIDLTQRLKTRFQVPLLPLLLLHARPLRTPAGSLAPDAWLANAHPPRDVVRRVEELVRIRRAEQELARLNASLVELATENGRLYDRARRDAESTTVLLRELQHRVRNNLASIQALLVLERHRTPPRDLTEAIDVAIARLRSMAALQDCLRADAYAVDLMPLAHAVGRGALEMFGTSGATRFEVLGTATLPAQKGGAVAIVLNELITNALKHARASVVSVSFDADEQHVRIAVTDDGHGMALAAVEGSGLIIVRAVVRNELGGQLDIEQRDPGTRFRIDIPMGAPYAQVVS